VVTKGYWPLLLSFYLLVPAQAGTQPVRLPSAAEFALFVSRQTNHCTIVYFLPLDSRLHWEDLVNIPCASVAN
jgi:hypothetical protein